MDWNKKKSIDHLLHTSPYTFFIGVSVDLNRYSLLYEVRRNHLWVLEFKWIVFARGLEEVFKTNIVQHKSVKFVGRIIN
jgi:hypothetical protein